MTDHWFDRRSQDLARRVSRRQSLRLVSLLTAGLAFGGATKVGATPRPGSKKKKGLCSKEFRSDEARKECRAVSRQCKKSGTGPFCVVAGSPPDPGKLPLCCGAGTVCCNRSCCGPFSAPEGAISGQCCPDNPARRRCLPASWTCCPGNPPDAANHGAPPGTSCCQHDRRGFCAANEFCCDGVGCVRKNTRENCSGCGDHCGPYLTCVGGGCGCPPGWAQCGAFSCYNTQTHECCAADRGDVRRIGECP